MSVRRSALVLALGAVAAYGPVLYPAALLLVARRRPEPEPVPGPRPARLSVVVAAYREAAVIGAKVHDCRANGWEGELEVVVVADDEATARAAEQAGAVVVAPGRRVGKAAALGLGVAAATGEVVVLSDANALLVPGSLAALARWFTDPEVGAVAGEKSVVGGAEGAYWRFESLLKRAESRLGGTVGLVGECAAVRRSAWQDVPADVAVDDLWIALDVLESGLRIPYEPAARASEAASDTLAQEWERRTRIVAGMLDVVQRRRHLLRGHGSTSAQLWGHRLVRVSGGPVAHAALLLLAAGHPGSRAARLLLVGHAAVAAGAMADARGLPVPGPVRAAGAVGFLQLVGLGGTWRWLRGDRPALWVKVDRSGA
jgi:biofilm PGA synthesis N-glycosyltransferase PgaC